MARAQEPRTPRPDSDRKILTNLHDIAYYNLAGIRSFELVNEVRGGQQTQKEDDLELEGLSALSVAKKVDILAKGNDDVKFDVFNEDKTQIYLIESKRTWTQTKVELCQINGQPILVMFCSHHGVACSARTVITVTHKRKEGLGCTIYSGHNGTVYDSNREAILKIVERAGAEKKVEHAIAEVDNTRVGLIQENSITFGDYNDTVEKALLFGAWVPIGLKIEINRGLFSCLTKKKRVEAAVDVKANYYLDEETDEAVDAGHHRRRRRHKAL